MKIKLSDIIFLHYIIIIIIIVIIIRNEQVVTGSQISTQQNITNTNSNKPFRIVSLFSSCLTVHPSNRTDHEMKSAMIQRLSGYLFTRDCMVPDSCPGLNFTDLYHYEAYDVCHDHDRLVKLLVDFNMDQKYFPTTTTKTNNANTEDANSPVASNNIVLVFTYLDRLMIDIVYSLLLMNKYGANPEILLFREGIVPTHSFLRGEFPHKGIAYQQSNSISTNFPDVGWNVIVVILIKIGSQQHEIEFYTEHYEATLKSIHKRKNLCVMSDIIESQKQFTETVDKLRHTNYQTPIILYGAEKYQIELLKRTEGNIVYRHKWVLNDISSEFITYKTFHLMRGDSIILIHRRFMYFKNKLFMAKNIHYFPHIVNLTSHDDDDGDICTSAKCRTIYGLCLDLFAAMKIGLREPGDKRTKRIHAKYIIHAYNQGNYKIAVNKDRHIIAFAHRYITDFKDVLQSNKCPHPECVPGFYKDFGEVDKTVWNHSRGWRCTRCPLNTIKTSIGVGKCVPCLSFLVSNEENTLCYDPYKKVSFKIEMTSVQLCLATSGFLCLAAVFTFVVFMRNKETWIVHSTDLKISTAHITLLVINFILPNISFLIDSNWIHWTVYLLSISLVNCCSLSIVLVKSKKLLQAFNSKVRVNRGETLRATYHQISIVILNMILTIVLFVFSIQMQGLKKESARNPTTFESIDYCKHDLHIVVQVMFLMSLQIACFVPAYQGRNLPSVFNNAMAVVYARFVMVACSLVFLPVFLFQNDPRHKCIVEHLTFQSLGLIQVSFLYWPKVYVLLFQKEKTSKQYLRTKTFSFSSISKS